MDISALHPDETAVASTQILGELPGAWTAEARVARLELAELADERKAIWEPRPLDRSVDGATLSLRIEYREDALVHSVEIALLDEAGQVRDVVSTGVVCVREKDLSRGPA